MKISVTSKDPILSFKTVGAIMDNYADLSEYLTSDAVFDPLEAPIVPTLQTIHFMPRKKSLQGRWHMWGNYASWIMFG